MNSTIVSVQGKGDFTLDLDNGNLKVSKDGVLLYVTKGNPTSPTNAPFASIDEALAYFQTTSEAQPIGGDENA
jgi:hypothetical protein